MQLIDRVALRHEIAVRELHNLATPGSLLEEVLLLIDHAEEVDAAYSEACDQRVDDALLGEDWSRDD